MYRYLIFALFLLNIIHAQTHEYIEKKWATYELEYLKHAITECHPNPFLYTSQTEFNSFIDQEINTLPAVCSFYELRNKIRRIVSKVHCVHTTLINHKISTQEALENNEKYFPFEVRLINEKLLILKNYSNDSTVEIGSEIISINDKPISNILEEISYYRSGDGLSLAFIEGIINLNFQFNLLYQLYHKNDSIYSVIIKKNDVKQTYNLPGIIDPNTKVDLKDSTIYEITNKAKNVFYKKLESNIGYIKITDFNGNQTSTYKKIMSNIKEIKTEKLIIDLRSNYGGSMINANDILSYFINQPFEYSLVTPINLEQFDYYNSNGMISRLGGSLYLNTISKSFIQIKNNYWYFHFNIEPYYKYIYQKKVYVLINEHTLSASSYLASQLKHKANATIIGSSSGGAEFGNGGYTYIQVTLPVTGSKLKMPHNYIDYNIGNSNGSLNVDKKIEMNIEDYIEKKDFVLEKAIKYISEK